MALMYGNIMASEEQTTRPIVENGLTSDTVFIPGVTVNFDTIEKNGVRYALKETNEASVDPSVAGTNGYHFTNADESLVQIVCNNQVSEGIRLYGVQEAAVPFDMKAYQMERLVKNIITPSIQKQGLAALAYEGQVIQSGGVADTTQLTTANIKDYLLGVRTALRKSKVSSDKLVCLVNPEIFSLIVKVAGSEFDGSLRNELNMNGNVGKWLGFTILECNMIGDTVKYVDYSGTLRTVNTADIDFICYSWDTLYEDVLVSLLKLQQAVTFNGSEVVSDFVTGWRVGTQAKTAIKKNA